MVQTMSVAEAGNASASGPMIHLAPGRDEAERNPVFDALVSPEGEISGLVAYSIYKQNKRAWLDDFIRLTGRPPTEAESRAYIIGESTERRLATYRQLAAATLTGDGKAPLPRPLARTAGALTGPLWALVALVALVVIGVIARAYAGH